MDIRKVKKLIELLEESNIDEIEIKEGEESVRISRNSAQSCHCRSVWPTRRNHRHRQPPLRQPPPRHPPPAPARQSALATW